MVLMKTTEINDKHKGSFAKPLMKEIRLKIFEPQDVSVFLKDTLSAGDSVYSRGNSFEVSRTPKKTC